MGCTASFVVSDQSNIKRKLKASTTINPTFNTVNNQTTTLSREDKEKIKESWKMLSNDMLGNGGKVMLRLIDMNGEIKHILGLVELEGKSLNDNAAFKLQCLRVMQTIGALVDNIDNMEDTVFPVLHELGRQHFAYNRFVQKLWNPFPEAVLYVWERELSDTFTPDVPLSWTPLLLLIVCKMKEGYQHACAEDTMKKLNGISDEV